MRRLGHQPLSKVPHLGIPELDDPSYSPFPTPTPTPSVDVYVSGPTSVSSHISTFEPTFKPEKSSENSNSNTCADIVANLQSAAIPCGGDYLIAANGVPDIRWDSKRSLLDTENSKNSIVGASESLREPLKVGNVGGTEVVAGDLNVSSTKPPEAADKDPGSVSEDEALTRACRYRMKEISLAA